MKRLFCAILLSLFFSGAVSAALPTSRRWNEFTRMWDYYQDLQTDSGVTVPQDYIASPTVDLLRDLLIAAGIMSAAPAEAVPAAVVFQDSPNAVFQDGANVVFLDSTN